MASRLTAESPEDLFGPLVVCPRDGCEGEWYSGDGSVCPECERDAADGFDPGDDDDFPEFLPVGFDGTGRR